MLYLKGLNLKILKRIRLCQPGYNCNKRICCRNSSSWFRLKKVPSFSALKEFLIKKYDKYLGEIGDGLRVEELFVPQRMMVKDESKKKPRQLMTYNDMFYTDENRAKKIYVIGKSGAGKTVFLRHLTNAWCRVHTTEAPRSSLSEIETIMLQYEYLFYISLCDEKRERNVHNIIINQLLEDNVHIEVFEQLMESESDQCLIILDGLNEFTLLDGGGKDNIPELDESKDYTAVMATRPWKTESVKPSNKTIEIASARVLSPYTFVRKAVNSLNKRYQQDKDFMKFLLTFGLVKCQQLEPAVLMLHIRLWYVDENNE